jgi:hypothetical protein
MPSSSWRATYAHDVIRWTVSFGDVHEHLTVGALAGAQEADVLGCPIVDDVETIMPVVGNVGW